MKRKVLLILLLFVVFISGCSKTNSNSDIKVTYIDKTEKEMFKDYTYKFIGESEHFYFQTGKAYYNGNDRGLLITNFNIKGTMDKDTRYTASVYFNDELFAGLISDKPDQTLEKYKNVSLYDYGTLGEEDGHGGYYGESDSFIRTTKETFKDSIKVKVDYCLKEDCKTEEMKITIVDEK